MTRPMTVGLVLSGGGARSFAQVGALLALEAAGVEVAAVAANSTGALLGALFAAGNSATKVHDIVQGIDYKGFLQPGGRGGLIDHSGLESLLREHVPETFEELVIPLGVPVVDIVNAEQLVFTSGPLIAPVCASNAFPGLFAPVELDGRHLMDGGILDNVPVDIIKAMTTAPGFVVDVRLSDTAPLDLDGDPGFWERLSAPFTRSVPLTVDVLMKAYTITQTKLIELLYTMYPPDYVVRPDLGDDFRLQDFDRFDEGVRLGFEATSRFLEQVEPAPVVDTGPP